MLGPSPFNVSVYAGGVKRGFEDLGYNEARAAIEYRSSEGSAELYAKQAKELVDMKCDLYVPLGTEAAVRALQALRPQSPIVFLAVDYDPLERGVITDLRRPDRNTTGVYVPQSALVQKRVEVLREILPKARRIVIFADRFSGEQVAAALGAAKRARWETNVVRFDDQPYDYAGALQSARKAGADAFMNLASPIFARDRKIIVDALEKERLPSIATNALQVQAGYLLSLNNDAAKVTRRVADIGVRILKGAKPVDIPIEQADEFELVINSSVAKRLGVRIPESVLARATRIIS